MSLRELQKFLQIQVDSVSPKQRDGYYSMISELILDRGVSFQGPGESLTTEELSILKNLSYMTFNQRECFYNAQRIAALSEHFKYWEGYAHGDAIIPVHHAWVTINGKVVDLTWRFFEEQSRVEHNPCLEEWKDRYAVGTFPKHAIYFGVEIDVSNAYKRMVDRGSCFSYLDDWEAGFPLLKRDAW